MTTLHNNNNDNNYDDDTIDTNQNDGIMLSSVSVSHTTNDNSTTPPRRLQTLVFYMSIFLFLFSTLFWIWAIVNSLRMEAGVFDGGIVSFFCVMGTSVRVIYILWNNNRRRNETNSSNTTTTTTNQRSTNTTCSILILPISSHILVCLNYAAGAIIAVQYNLNVPYLVSFTFVWIGLTTMYASLAIQYLRQQQHQQVAEE